MAFQFTDENFAKEALEASKEKPVLIDFFADWCGPCKMQGPVVSELAETIGDKAIVGKLDTESAQQTAQRYGIMSIPTLLIIRHGKVVEQMVGLQSKAVLEEMLNKHI